jgi:SHS2 domain-containing protein
MTRTPLAHTADTGLEATAPDLAGLITELALGMFELMGEIEPCPGGREQRAEVRATTAEDLVVDCLSELLYLSETEDVHFCLVEAEQTGEWAVVMHIRGVPTKSVVPTGPPIKAVTYHRLEVARRSEGWYGRVYFDV